MVKRRKPDQTPTERAVQDLIVQAFQIQLAKMKEFCKPLGYEVSEFWYSLTPIGDPDKGSLIRLMNE